MANQLASYFQGLLSKLKGGQLPKPQDPNYGIPQGAFTTLPSGDTVQLAPIGFNAPETPTPQTANVLPPKPKPTVPPRQESDREKDLYGQFNNALGQLGTSPPKPTPTTQNPAESIAAALLSGGVHGNPGLQSRIQNIPFENAVQSAQSQDAYNQSVYQANQKAANSQLDYVTSALGHELSRDAVTERMQNQLDMQDVKSQAAQTVATIKTMPQFWAQLGKYGAGLGAPAVSQALTEMGMTDPNEIQAVTQGILTDPSSPLLLKKAQIDNQREHNQNIDQTNLRNVSMNPNAKSTDRLSAMMQLATMGDPLYQGMNALQLQQMANQTGAQTQSLIAGAHAKESTVDLNKARGDAAKAQAHLAQARADVIPAESKARIDKMHADAEHARRVANEAAFNGGKPITGTAFFNAQRSITTAMGKADAMANEADGLASSLEQQATDIQLGRRAVVDKSGNEIQKGTPQWQSHIAELQDQANQYRTVGKRWHDEYDHLQTQMDGIAAKQKQQQTEGGAGSNVDMHSVVGKIAQFMGGTPKITIPPDRVLELLKEADIAISKGANKDLVRKRLAQGLTGG